MRKNDQPRARLIAEPCIAEAVSALESAVQRIIYCSARSCVDAKRAADQISITLCSCTSYISGWGIENVRCARTSKFKQRHQKGLDRRHVRIAINWVWEVWQSREVRDVSGEESLKTNELDGSRFRLTVNSNEQSNLFQLHFFDRPECEEWMDSEDANVTSFESQKVSRIRKRNGKGSEDI